MELAFINVNCSLSIFIALSFIFHWVVKELHYLAASVLLQHKERI